MDEFRCSTLRKMLGSSDPETLGGLIFERLSMDLLTKLAPIVLENLEQDDGKFDDLASPLFCRSFLNSHYERDTILELVGKELEAEKKRKPDRLSEIMKIIQKRDDLKNNRKKLKPKLTIEFKKKYEILDAGFVKCSGSYVCTV